MRLMGQQQQAVPARSKDQMPWEPGDKGPTPGPPEVASVTRPREADAAAAGLAAALTALSPDAVRAVRAV